MYKSISNYLQERANEFQSIGQDRKAVLEQLAAYILVKQQQLADCQLLFVCTHNSRRSHFAQVFAALGAAHYGLKRVASYSGGTEATRVHPHTLEALERVGFVIKHTGTKEEPVYECYFSNEHKVSCFSKRIDHPSVPKSDFAAVMTCSEAEQNCPFVPGTELRIGLPYDDPRHSDGTASAATAYDKTRDQIARELLFVFDRVKKQLHD